MTSPPEPADRPTGRPADADARGGPSGAGRAAGPADGTGTAGGTGSGQGSDAAAPGFSDASAPRDSEGTARATLHRSSRQKVVGGVCGGLGRYCDVDPVIFRIVIGVLTVAGGLGMIFYGFAWLLIPLEGEEENEGRKMLSGRVDGTALIAVLLALIGCGLFLSMLSNGGTLSFAVMLTIAAAGSAVWSQRRRSTASDGRPLDPVTAHTVAEAPPETKAPPVPGSPSWWRDPIVKDGTTGLVGSPYLWGPADTYEAAGEGGPGWRGAGQPGWGPGLPGERSTAVRTPRPVPIGGLLLVLALVAGGIGAGLSWHGHPLGTSLEMGLACALAVLGIGLAVSSFLGRTGFGTVFLTVLTTLLLAGAAALPKDVETQWREHTWRPATGSAVQSRYNVGSGIGTLDLTGVKVPAGRTVTTSVRVGAGQIKVYVPADVTLDVRAKAGVGDIELPGDPPHDVDFSPSRSLHRTLPPESSRASAPGAPGAVTTGAHGGTLALTLDVGLGQVKVARDQS